MVSKQKGGVETNLPNKAYRGRYGTIVWDSDKKRVKPKPKEPVDDKD